MRIGTALALALVVGISGFLGLSSKAYAVNLNIPGILCRNFNAAEVADIDYDPTAITVVNLDEAFVICPIVRSPTSTNAVSVYVDGFATTGTTITCTLYSYNIDGSLVDAQTFTAQPGKIDRFVTIPGVYWGNASVLCLLPGHGWGAIFDIDVVQ